MEVKFFDSAIEETEKGGRDDQNAAYIIPTHCTGRLAIQLIEKAMPDSFILNMSGTRLTFSAI